MREEQSHVVGSESSARIMRRGFCRDGSDARAQFALVFSVCCADNQRINLSASSLDRALWTVAAFLEEAAAPAEQLVIIGGSALLALGIVSRTTQDVDILAGVDPEQGLVDPRPISKTLQTAAVKVAGELGLAPDWLNTGPADQIYAGLPEGFLSRLTKREYGPL